MNLTPKDIGEFQELWFKQYGQQLPPEKAREQAEVLLKTLSIALDDDRPP